MYKFCPIIKYIFRNITAAAFRVVGILKSSSLAINGQYAFVRQQDLWKILGIGNEIHEIAVVTEPLVEEEKIEKTN